jgi:hypothetical protein
MILENEESYNRPTASWRPWDNKSMSQFKSKGLRIWWGLCVSSGVPRLHDLLFWSPSAGEKNPSTKREGPICLCSVLVVSGISSIWMVAIHTEGGSFPLSPLRLLCYSFLETSSQIHPKQSFRHFLIQSSWYLQLTITEQKHIWSWRFTTVTSPVSSTLYLLPWANVSFRRHCGPQLEGITTGKIFALSSDAGRPPVGDRLE